MNLAEWQAGQAELGELAGRWHVEFDLRATEEGNSRGPGVQQAHLVCGRDRQSVLTLAPDVAAGAYLFTADDLRAAVLRHVRECHCDGGGTPLGC